MEWLAADYDTRLIVRWTTDRQDWPRVDKRLIHYYRRSSKWGPEIERLRKERRESAINTGLALKEERIARLCKHADELEAIKWMADERGRLWNEKAWRETLDDIAKEMGHRSTKVDVRFVLEEARRIADRLGLDPDAVVAEAERIVKARSDVG